MSTKVGKKDILEYHSGGRPGKIEVIPSKPANTQRDLSIAYSPGVAVPCMEIHENKENVYKYTAKGNLVAVISNGTAVLGLGDIGPEASKPVMEGKGLLFKIYADIDVFDIELNATDTEAFIQAVKAMEPTFGGINLEDIKAPDCFEIERRLKEELSIPIMHDDQHGTAIIAGAALLNALELAGKPLDSVRVVFNGAGASAISCARLFEALGVKRENIVMLDSKGVIRKGAEITDENKLYFATSLNLTTLEDAMKNADVFVGLSKGNVVNADMIRSMADNPVVFALANPDPEIPYDEAISARPDVIVATGRSDHPNQVNNVLGFPYIFRGALDVRATKINEEMKLAAVKALADLAKQPVPDVVNVVYNDAGISFGPKYIIPKPVDPRLIYTVAPAVAKAAVESGVARNPITDWDGYVEELKKRLGLYDKFTRMIMEKARQSPKRVVFAEGTELKVLKAAQIVHDEGFAYPVLLGNREEMERMMAENGLDMPKAKLMDIYEEKELRARFAELFYNKRKRKGVTAKDAEKRMRDRNYFGMMLVETGEADAFIGGHTRKYVEVIKPAMEIIGTSPQAKRLAGMYVLPTKKGPLFLADTTVNINPSVEEIIDITLSAASTVRGFNMTPRIALLSYSNFGAGTGEMAEKMRKATAILQRDYPDLIVDGEMQANFAVNNEMLSEVFPFSNLVGKAANTLIFPDLASGNIAYKLLQSYGVGDAIGPILMGINKPVHILQIGCSVREMVSMAAVAVVDCQHRKERSSK
jgi:malate dehydrogenase (oxaloacetate-decarboxylating)(NADP+)